MFNLKKIESLDRELRALLAEYNIPENEQQVFITKFVMIFKKYGV